MRLEMTSAVGVASLLGLVNMPPLSATGSAFSFMGDMPGVYFDGGEAGGGSGGSGGTGGGGEGGQQNAGPTQADIDALKAQLATITKERDTFKGKVEAADQANLSEADKQKKLVDDAKAEAGRIANQLKEANLGRVVEREARKLNIVDEEAAFALLSKADVQYDNDGNPTNVVALLEKLVKAKPYLVGTAAGSAGTGGSTSNAARGRAGNGNEVKPGLDRIRHAYSKSSS